MGGRLENFIGDDRDLRVDWEGRIELEWGLGEDGYGWKTVFAQPIIFLKY